MAPFPDVPDVPLATPDAAGADATDVAALDKCRVVLGLGNAAETTALQAVLKAAGAEVTVATEAWMLVEVAKRVNPGVILLDAAMTGLDLGHATRILSRHPSTAGSAVLLLATADADARKLRLLNELGVFGVLRRPLTCSSIRSTFGRAARRHLDIASSGATASHAASKLIAGCNALLRKPMSCPFHSFGVPVESYTLRAGKVYVDSDMFDVPVYKPGGRGGQDFVDFHHAGVAVCRECYFATSEAGYFDNLEAPLDDDERPATLRIDAVTRQRIAADAGCRGLAAHDELGGEPPEALFTWRRDDRLALVAYGLALRSSRVLYETAPIRRASELHRMSGYELRRGLLHDRLGSGSARVLKHRDAARVLLSKAFTESKGVTLYRAAYTLVALNVHLGREAQAMQYLQTLRDQTRLGHRDIEDPPTLERYLRRATEVWEDRRRHRHPDVSAKAA